MTTLVAIAIACGLFCWTGPRLDFVVWIGLHTVAGGMLGRAVGMLANQRTESTVEGLMVGFAVGFMTGYFWVAAKG